MKKVLHVMNFLVLLALQGMAQSQISGTIMEAVNGMPLPGAAISVANGQIVTTSDEQGKYLITISNKGIYHLQVTYLGYKPFEKMVEAKGKVQLDISLEPMSYLSEEVIIRATRLPANAPASRTYLDKEAIGNLNTGRDLPYVIAGIPSAVVTSDAGTGIGYTGIRIRGSDMTRINVTLNGIPYNDPESHEVYWVDLPDIASSVDNIEVQRGVGTSSNGAAAFGASINIQTGKTQAEPYGEVLQSAGSFSSFRSSVSAGSGLINKHFAFDTRLSRISSDGFIDRSASQLSSFFTSATYLSNKHLLKANVFSGKEITHQAWDGVPSGILDTNRAYNVNGLYYDAQGKQQFYHNEIDNYQQDHYQLLYSFQMTRKTSLNISSYYTRGKGYYEQYKEDEELATYLLQPVDPLAGKSDLIVRKWLKNDFYGLSWVLSKESGPWHAISGAAWNRYSGDHFGRTIWTEKQVNQASFDHQWYLNSGEKEDANAFIKVLYYIHPDVGILADLQYRSIEYDMSGLDDDLRLLDMEHKYDFWNPKAGINWKLNKENNAHLYAGIANREPNRSNFKDADPGSLPKPERLYNVEAGHDWQRNSTRLQANLYYMYYTDQLALTGKINAVGAPIMTNVPHSYRRGFELMASTRINKYLQWSANATISQNHILNQTEYIDNWDDGSQIIQHLGKTSLSFSPSIIANNNLLFNILPSLQLEFSTKYVGKQYIDNTSSDARKLDPYCFSDARILFKPGQKLFKHLEFSLMIFNLFNEAYESNAWIYKYYYQNELQVMDGYFPQAGRHYLAGIKARI